ncbi:hypothetical protein L249_0433 [Ophiocordyceps polyrhachis-furcata BCC 54312]|uniref:Uncharacterized protein n=1 Tax=Ophiocordyceps polyrhachis-furcata BCC 54312 TaxID=1330021 RepID=A0A367LDF9_9HYPO|nr:hypothetical protein L249_0433 [Ophiocordyceps polyrhachis-furcata BCC 54312]
MPQLFGNRGSSTHSESLSQYCGLIRKPPQEGYLFWQVPLHLSRSAQLGEEGTQMVSLGQGAIFRPHGRPAVSACAAASAWAAAKLAKAVARARMVRGRRTEKPECLVPDNGALAVFQPRLSRILQDNHKDYCVEKVCVRGVSLSTELH